MSRSAFRMISVCFAAALLSFMTSQQQVVEAHIEDICVTPPGDCLTCGIYNFYSIASKSGCRYLDKDPKCIVATLAAQSKGGFNDTSNCRGIIHFNAIYFIAVSLGFKRDIAYQMAAFSQAIDFAQYKGVDSCGRPMDNAYWTPPMRGFLRTETTYGGTNRHLGVPFVGLYDNITVSPDNLNQTSLTGDPLFQFEKQYKGQVKRPNNFFGCQRRNFEEPYKYYESTCPGLRPRFDDFFYEGALASARKWAFNDTDLLCIAGFTKPNPVTGSLFSGDSCPTNGSQFQVNINSVVQGPIPLTGSPMTLGEQVLHFDCLPNCTAPSYTVAPGSIVYASQFKEYLENQAETHGYAVMKDPPGVVPETVARFGIFLHWVADRVSHWYCCDASGSGVKAVKQGDHYNLFMYLSKSSCNFVGHGMVHYWEQGVSKLAPGSYFALVAMHDQIAQFKDKFHFTHPEWFRKNATVLSFPQVIGTPDEPGILHKITNIPDALKRFNAEVKALKRHNLPAMPGFESLCVQNRTKKSLRNLILNKIDLQLSGDMVDEVDIDDEDGDEDL